MIDRNKYTSFIKDEETKLIMIKNMSKIQGVQKYLFSYEGPIEKTDIDGELRITIDEDPKQKELKQLFEPQN